MWREEITMATKSQPKSERIVSTGEDQKFLESLKTILSTPAQTRGKTTRSVLVASQVYHDEDFPVVGKDSKK